MARRLLWIPFLLCVLMTGHGLFAIMIDLHNAPIAMLAAIAFWGLMVARFRFGRRGSATYLPGDERSGAPGPFKGSASRDGLL